MSANLLEKVTPGWRANLEKSLYEEHINVFDGEGQRIASINADDTMEINGGAIAEVLSRAAKANAQLIALAYDHALWGAATARKVASWFPLAAPDEARGEVIVEGMRHLTSLDVFAIPALTPALRAALRAAVGLKAQP